MARLIALALVLLSVFASTRYLVRALPGDPLQTILAESGTSMPPEQIRRELGLDRPFLPALAEDLRNAVHGDLGHSLLSKQPVAPLVGRRLWMSAKLALAGLALGLSAAVALGVTSAARPGSVIDKICSGYGALMAATPIPWKGPILLLAFAVWIPIFDVDRSIALPAITLALGYSGYWSRLIRERVRETLRSGAAPGARARGIPEWKVLLKYGLAPSSGALVAYLGTSLGGLLAGAVVIELIFNYPGMGTLTVESVLRRDYPVIEATTFISASAILLGTLLGDFAQSWIDPRREAR